MCNLGLEDNYIFQEDNDPKHKARVTTNFKNEMEIEVMEWPPQSPDLNPIEEIWAIMKKEI